MSGTATSQPGGIAASSPGGIATTSQTAGPYWHLIEHPEWADLLRAHGPNAGYTAGQRIALTGRITDGSGAAVADAMVEIWQADPEGRYDAGFHGFGRCATDKQGRFRFTTVKPGAVPTGLSGQGNALQAPHVALTIFARGLLKQLVTRLYFEGEALNGSDPVLTAIPDPARRATLVARPAGDDAITWNLDIRLQGDGETVFLEV